ncbi:tyrosine-type recombinase/integrase [Dechloromonas sp. ZY10]|uniref:tyrosine-type recombinase/integrase n=1 Tax=Dechloromonas aquae TaxID=2664436 RepID=UPI00352906A7
MGRSQSGIYQDQRGFWCIDKVFKGTRLRQRFERFEEAESWLILQLEQLRQRHLFGVRPKWTFDQAAAKYLLDHQDKVSLQTDIYLLEKLMPFIGKLTLDQIHDQTLAVYVEQRKAAGRSNKTINLGLGIVRRILNLAARKWRDEEGRTWLETPPLISMLPLIGFQREPRPITWAEQRQLLPHLADHLAKMVLFDLNTGARDEVVCGLRWEWEIYIPELERSVFDVPRESVKGRKRSRVLVCNSVAQSIIEGQRGLHSAYVFPFRGDRIETVSNSGWQRAREAAGLPDLRFHDLRHTVGMRLREAGVREETISDILWHTRRGMTAHYSVAQIEELVEALERITDERSRTNRSLEMIRREMMGKRTPPFVPAESKKANQKIGLTA